MGISPSFYSQEVLDGTRRAYLEEQTELQVRSILDEEFSDPDQAKKHSWIFSDFRGMAILENSSLSAKDYERVANRLEQPFVHVILRCNDHKRDSIALLSRTASRNDVVDFAILQSIWETENVPTEGMAHELELDIGRLTPGEIAEKIFEGISETLNL
jgi:hypothetical protein